MSSPSERGTAGEGDDPSDDGRVLRGRRTRDAIVEAVMALVEEGNLSPTADQVAQRAGVARRSVYHHFDDLDDLTLAVLERHLDSYVELLTPIPTSGPFEDRLAAFVTARCTFAERLSAVHRSCSIMAPNSPVIARQVEASGEFLRAEVAQTFCTELEHCEPWMLEALDSLTSLDGWVRLRVNQRLSVREAERVVCETLRALLTPG